MGKAHGGKALVVSALAEFRLVLVTVEGQLETLVPQLLQGSAKIFNKAGIGPLGTGDDQDTEGSAGEITQFMQDRRNGLEIPHAIVMKTQQKLSVHVLQDSFLRIENREKQVKKERKKYIASSMEKKTTKCTKMSQKS